MLGNPKSQQNVNDFLNKFIVVLKVVVSFKSTDLPKQVYIKVNKTFAFSRLVFLGKCFPCTCLSKLWEMLICECELSYDVYSSTEYYGRRRFLDIPYLDAHGRGNFFHHIDELESLAPVSVYKKNHPIPKWNRSDNLLLNSLLTPVSLRAGLK